MSSSHRLNVFTRPTWLDELEWSISEDPVTTARRKGFPMTAISWNEMVIPNIAAKHVVIQVPISVHVAADISVNMPCTLKTLIQQIAVFYQSFMPSKELELAASHESYDEFHDTSLFVAHALQKARNGQQVRRWELLGSKDVFPSHDNREPVTFRGHVHFKRFEYVSDQLIRLRLGSVSCIW